MARVTVEDCLDYVENRFELVLEATKRARQLLKGGEPFVDWEGDKTTVVALREIAAGHLEDIRKAAIRSEEQAQLESQLQDE